MKAFIALSALALPGAAAPPPRFLLTETRSFGPFSIRTLLDLARCAPAVLRVTGGR